MFEAVLLLGMEWSAKPDCSPFCSLNQYARCLYLYDLPGDSGIMTKNRWIHFFCSNLVLSFGLLLAGCSSATEQTICRDELRCVVVEPGEPVSIAAMLVISGANSHLGEDQLGAIRIALVDYGPLLGHEIELTVEDSQCNAEGGQTAALKIAADPTVAGVLGTACSSAATAALPVIAGSGLSMIAASNTSPILTDPNRDSGGVWLPGYYRTSHTSLLLGELVANFAYHQLGVRKIATIHDGSVYALKLTAAMAQDFENLGGMVSFVGSVNVGETEMHPILTDIATYEPELIFFPIFQPEGNFIAVQAKEVIGLEDVYLVGAGGLFLSDFAVNSGASAIGMYLASPRISNERYDQLLLKWEEKIGGTPPAGYHAHMYDATFLLLDAILAATEVDENSRLTIGLQAVRDKLNAVEEHVGVTGLLTCNQTGDCASRDTLAIYMLKQENVDGVWPPQVVFQPERSN